MTYFLTFHTFDIMTLFYVMTYYDLIFDIITYFTYFLTLWRYFWYHYILFYTFWRYNAPFIMYFLTSLLTLWHTFLTLWHTIWHILMTRRTFHTFWCPDVALDIMTFFFQLSILCEVVTWFLMLWRNWRHDSAWRHVLFDVMMYLLTSWRTLITYWRFDIHFDIPFDILTYFPYLKYDIHFNGMIYILRQNVPFDVMTHFPYFSTTLCNVKVTKNIKIAY